MYVRMNGNRMQQKAATTATNHGGSKHHATLWHLSHSRALAVATLVPAATVVKGVRQTQKATNSTTWFPYI